LRKSAKKQFGEIPIKTKTKKALVKDRHGANLSGQQKHLVVFKIIFVPWMKQRWF
jgi:hypothetical protein